MRFDDKTLEGFLINPRRPGYWAKCPFCGGDIIVGHRVDNDHRTLAHSAVPDPLHPGAMLAACERFTEVGLKQPMEFFRLAAAAAVQWRPLTE
jgi:hypothetical protein